MRYYGFIANICLTLYFVWGIASGPVKHYNVKVSLNYGDFELFGITRSSTPAYVLKDGLVDGGIYRVKVQAVDASGNTGPESEPSDPVVYEGNKQVLKLELILKQLLEVQTELHQLILDAQAIVTTPHE